MNKVQLKTESWLNLSHGCQPLPGFLTAGSIDDFHVQVLGSVSGSGRPLGEGNGYPLQYSCLGSPMDGGAWQATVHRVAQSQTWLCIWAQTHAKSSLFVSERPEAIVSFLGDLYLTYCLRLWVLWPRPTYLVLGLPSRSLAKNFLGLESAEILMLEKLWSSSWTCLLCWFHPRTGYLPL